MVDLTGRSGQGSSVHSASKDGVAKEAFSVRICILRLLGIRTNQKPINEKKRVSYEASSMLFAPLTSNLKETKFLSEQLRFLVKRWSFP